MFYQKVVANTPANAAYKPDNWPVKSDTQCTAFLSGKSQWCWVNAVNTQTSKATNLTSPYSPHSCYWPLTNTDNPLYILSPLIQFLQS